MYPSSLKICRKFVHMFSTFEKQDLSTLETSQTVLSPCTCLHVCSHHVSLPYMYNWNVWWYVWLWLVGYTLWWNTCSQRASWKTCVGLCHALSCWQLRSCTQNTSKIGTLETHSHWHTRLKPPFIQSILFSTLHTFKCNVTCNITAAQ